MRVDIIKKLFIFPLVFRAIQDGGARGAYALQGSQSSLFAFRRLIYQTKLGKDMFVHGNASKKPIKRLSCEIWPKYHEDRATSILKWRRYETSLLGHMNKHILMLAHTHARACTHTHTHTEREHRNL